MADPEQDVRIAAVADQLHAPVALLAADGTLLYVNAAHARAVSQTPERLVGQPILDYVHPEDRDRLEGELADVTSRHGSSGSTSYRLRVDPAREWRVFESIVDNLLHDPVIGGLLVSSRDVTDQRAYERALYDAAYRDPLTALPNRVRVDAELEALVASDEPVAVAFLGLDRFKLINDSLGHTTGDAVLQVVSARVASSAPASTVVGRFGGDVLVLLISGPAAIDARALLWRAVARIGEPLFLAGHELRLACSAGIAHKDSSATAESLLRDAGLALHRAKLAGGDRVEVFEVDMRRAAVARLELEANLRRAVARSELALALQPVVRLEDTRPVGAEALVRWRHRGQDIPPCEFIPVAEETGLIVPMGDWIIDRAAQLAAEAPGGMVSVNLSARQLAVPGVPDRIARALASRQVPASRLAFEVTETLLVERFDYAASVLRAIRQLGCRVGLDDFGTGYSSLGYLRRLPIDFLKIDGSLVVDIDDDPQARAIVGAIITMAGALGLDVVAEGVETVAQADALRGLGAIYAQGYLFGRPQTRG